MEELRMSMRARERLKYLVAMETGGHDARWLASRTGVRVVQARRIGRRWAEEGSAGVVHGLRGRRSNNAAPGELRSRVLELWREGHEGWPATHFGEELEREQGLVLSWERLRRRGLAGGVLARRRKGQGHRQRRERSVRFGEMLQADGSDHPWHGAERERAFLYMNLHISLPQKVNWRMIRHNANVKFGNPGQPYFVLARSCRVS